MLISLGKRFMFVANTKTASTTVELSLKQNAEVAIVQTRYGKHMSYATAVNVFRHLFKNAEISPEECFRFGVIRDPLDWVVSWYNYRCRQELIDSPDENVRSKSCYGIPFEQFVHEVTGCENKPVYAQIGVQRRIFLDKAGGFGIDFLIPLPRLSEDLELIGAAVGIDRHLTHGIKSRNISPKITNVSDVANDTACRIREHFLDDMTLYNKAIARDFGSPASIVEAKKGGS